MGIYVGFDIGGTKCAAVTGVTQDGDVRILAREAFSTPADQREAMERLCALAERMADGQPILGVGISSGGPMDAAAGMLCNPPNLPGWSGLSLTDFARQRL
ncbi:MAG: ROK family protein, partial [Candidatus Spyradocola sp.]